MIDALLNNDSPLFSDFNNGDLEDHTYISTDPFDQELNVDDLLVDSSVMFPILDSPNGDVNDLFGELESFLSVSASHYSCHHLSITVT